MSSHRFPELIARAQRLLQAARAWLDRTLAPEAPAPAAAPTAPSEPAPSAPPTRAAHPPTPTAPRADDDKARLIARLVDMIDLLAGMSARATLPAQRADLLLVRTRLIEAIEAHGATLIDSDQWDGNRQKPIGVEPDRDPLSTGPRIVRKGSTGFTFLGRVYRKQEVVLSQPPSARPAPGGPPPATRLS